ncbi:MAG: DUF4430 domain-containing protein [Candidatus Wildermuthbacteria bacterium]|nr:DUF4430 domain-containing protein [Candidatus Wildermuthbacteria bacterium]
MARYKFFIGFLLSGVFLFALLGAVSFLGQDNYAREAISAPSATTTHDQPELRFDSFSRVNKTIDEEEQGESFGQTAFMPAERVAELPLKYEREGLIRATFLAVGQEYEVWLPEGATAYDLMASAAESSEFEFRGRNFWEMGFFVEEINGIVQDRKEKMYWIYYINGEKALVGVSQYVIQTNDVIEWKYEKEI